MPVFDMTRSGYRASSNALARAYWTVSMFSAVFDDEYGARRSASPPKSVPPLVNPSEAEVLETSSSPSPLFAPVTRG